MQMHLQNEIYEYCISDLEDDGFIIRNVLSFEAAVE